MTKTKNGAKNTDQIGHSNIFNGGDDETVDSYMMQSKQSSSSYTNSDSSSSVSDDSESCRDLMIEFSSSSEDGKKAGNNNNAFDVSSLACVPTGNQKSNLDRIPHNNSPTNNKDLQDLLISVDKSLPSDHNTDNKVNNNKGEDNNNGSNYWKEMFQCGPVGDDHVIGIMSSMDSHELKLEQQDMYSFSKYVDGKVEFIKLNQDQENMIKNAKYEKTEKSPSQIDIHQNKSTSMVVIEKSINDEVEKIPEMASKQVEEEEEEEDMEEEELLRNPQSILAILNLLL